MVVHSLTKNNVFFLTLSLILLFETKLALFQQFSPEIRISSTDSYGTPFNGEFSISCERPDKDMWKVGSTMDVINENTGAVLGSKPCEPIDFTDISFWIPSNSSDVFGRLRCRYHADTSKILVDPHTSKNCIDDAPCDNDLTNPKFCVATKSEEQTCSSLQSSWCAADRTSHLHYCPSDEAGICLSVAKNPVVWFEWHPSPKVQCPALSEPPLSYKGKSIFNDYPFVIDRDDPKEVHSII